MVAPELLGKTLRCASLRAEEDADDGLGRRIAVQLAVRDAIGREGLQPTRGVLTA